MPMSLAVTGLPITVVPAAGPASRIPIDWVLASGSGPHTPATLHSLPDTVLPVRVAPAPLLTWMPFWAITVWGPAPVTVFPLIVAIEPVPFTTIPVFW